MTNEQREAIDRLKKYIEEDDFYNIYKEIKEDEREGKIGGTHIVFCKAIDTVLSLIKEQQEEIVKLKVNLAKSCADRTLDRETLKNQENENLEALHRAYNEELDKKNKQIDLIKEYVHQEIVHCTETIKDYSDDDKYGNKHYIEELKEEREHWRDVEKLLQNKPKEELYMNWWRYGLYE